MNKASYPTSLRYAILALLGVFALVLLVASSFMISKASPRLQTAAIKISFQDGVYPASTYLGTTDTSIYGRSDLQKVIKGNDPLLKVGGGTTIPPGGTITDTYTNTLISWDVSSISSLATVQAVSVTLYVTNTSTSNYSFFQMNKAWSENQATWITATTGITWSVPGAGGGLDRSFNSLAVFSPSSTGYITIPLNTIGIAYVDSWVKTPSNNKGLIITNYANPNGAWFYSSDASTLNRRPKLTIKYAPQSTVTTTPPVVQGVSIVKSVSPTQQQVGGFFTFRIDVTNNTTTTLNSPILVDSFPSVLTVTTIQPSSGTFTYNSGTRTVSVTFASIAKNGTAYVTILAQVNSTATTNSTQTNSGSLSFQIPPPGSQQTFTKASNSVTYSILGSSGTLPETGGMEAPAKPSGIFLAALVIGALLAIVGLTGIIIGLSRRKRDDAWSGWFTRMGILLLVSASVFGVISWLARPEAGLQSSPQLAESGEASTPTTSPAWILQEGGYIEIVQTPTPMTLPNYPIPTPKIEGTQVAGEQKPDTSPVVQIEIPALSLVTVVKYVPFDGVSWLIGGLKQEVAWMGDTSWPGLGKNTGLAGHVTLNDGSAGPFAKLYELKTGDVVVLHTDENIYTYRVRMQTTTTNGDMDVLDAGDKPTITLITCTRWDKDLKVYLERLIVVADLEKVEPIQQAFVGN